ncbi:MAG: hypothetical protein AAF265_07980 [Pseudomonadota bacterium]
MTILILGFLVAANAWSIGDHERPKDRKAHNAFVEALKVDHPIIALVPIRMMDVPEHDAAVAEFHELLTIKLERFEYQIVPADVYAEAWQAELESIGGIYDAVTGRRNEEKFAAAQARVRAAIQASHGATAFLETSIDNREIPHQGGLARFGGVKSWPHVKGAARLGGSTLNIGVVRALSLHAELYSAAGELLFENYGGIQLLTRETREGKTMAYPADELLRNTEFNKGAIHLALRNMLYDGRTLQRDQKAKRSKKPRKP